MNSRLALGTAQFGMAYGIANAGGQISCDRARAILEQAHNNSINTIDTAVDYGSAEQCLGSAELRHWKVISKLPTLPDQCNDIEKWVFETTHGSLQRLDVNQLYALLLHHPRQLQGANGDALYQSLKKLKQQNKVLKIGLSIYGPEELDQLWPKYQFDLIQSPYNILDQRLKLSGWLDRLHSQNVEIHARSIFLQGLLLMSKAERPAWFQQWNTLWTRWHQWCEQHSVTALNACLSFVLSEPKLDKIIVGVDSAQQLADIISHAKQAPCQYPEMAESFDQTLINPSLWKRA